MSYQEFQQKVYSHLIKYKKEILKIGLEGSNQRAQLRLCAKRTVVVGEPVQVVIAHRGAST